MRALVILAILATLAIIGSRFYYNRDWKRLLISFGLFAIVLSSVGLGGMMRGAVPIL